jgi:hypothetical protein
MKKWSLILWFAAIVGAAFIVTACGEDDSEEGETFTDVSNYYALVKGEGSTDVDTSGLEIASALRNTSTGDVTIVLKGELPASYQAVAAQNAGGSVSVALGDSIANDGNWTDAVWGYPGSLSADPGVYGAVYIDGLITRSIVLAGTVAIKQTNEALRLYGKAGDLLSAEPQAPVVPGGASGNIWIPDAGSEGIPTKWKVYINATTQAPNLGTDPFGVLIWNGGDAEYSSKLATLEVEKATISGTYESGSTATATVGKLLEKYIIDYSEVVFGTTP